MTNIFLSVLKLKLRAASLFFLLVAGLTVSAQPGTGPYAIKNMQTGMLLRIKDANTANGTPLVSYTPENWKCMTWDFRKIEENTYQLQNLFSHKTLQPGQPAAGSIAMEEQPLVKNGGNQLYEFLPVEKNVYLIRLKETDLYVTASADEQVNGAIVLNKRNGSRLQQWTLHEQHPTM